MTRDATIRLGLRSIAIAIAMLAVIDPPVTSNRHSATTVSIVPADSPADRDVANHVAQVLDRRFTVVRGPAVDANVSVVVGSGVPSNVSATPAFVVTPSTTRRRIDLLAVDAPRTARLNARVTAHAVVRVARSAGETIIATLRAGDLVVDRATRVTHRDDDTLSIPLDFVPTKTGAVSLSVDVSTSRSSSSRDLVVAVDDRRLAVLFYDARPSWSAAFVRHAAQGDPRFTVIARTATSRSIASSIGSAPLRLSDVSSLAPFDAIVVGAPDALPADDVAGLEAFMRRRGGSVILLEEQRTASPVDRLTGVSSWNIVTLEQPTTITATGDSVSWKATQILSPSSMPSGADLLASAGSRAVMWSRPVGAGQLIVSGALDAWRFRDPELSGFARAWPRLIADAAASSLPPIDAQLSPGVVAPGDRVSIEGEVRDVALSRATSPVGVGGIADSVGTLALWPAGVGQFRGSFRAPHRPGLYHVSVRANAMIGDVPLRVGTAPRAVTYAPRPMLEAWASAHGGAMVSEDSLDRLPDAIIAKLGAVPRLETWHPMRSIWWLLPFVLALSAEWWMRRRQGLR